MTFEEDFPSLKGHCSFDSEVDYDCGDNVISVELIQENCLDKKIVSEAIDRVCGGKGFACGFVLKKELDIDV